MRCWTGYQVPTYDPNSSRYLQRDLHGTIKRWHYKEVPFLCAASGLVAAVKQAKRQVRWSATHPQVAVDGIHDLCLTLEVELHADLLGQLVHRRHQIKAQLLHGHMREPDRTGNQDDASCSSGPMAMGEGTELNEVAAASATQCTVFDRYCAASLMLPRSISMVRSASGYCTCSIRPFKWSDENVMYRHAT